MIQNKMKMFFKRRLPAFLFGERCACCCGIIEYGDLLCEKCAKQIKRIENPCLKCGCCKTMCLCHKKHFEFSHLVSPFFFTDAVKNGIWNMKFEGQTACSRFFAREMVKSVEKHYGGATHFDAVVCVPLSRQRLAFRGYNQSRLLAKQIAKALELPFYDDALKKLYDNPEQHNCETFCRGGNVLGVYEANDEVCAGKSILLVDDVVTTGSSLNECAKMLLISGAARVSCVCAAAAYNGDKL